MPEPSILDERLAEIDRRLRVIQSGLVPVEDLEMVDDAADEEPAAEPAAPADEVPASGDGIGAFGDGPAESEPAVPPIPLWRTSVPTAPPAPPAPPAPAAGVAPDRLAELVEGHERLLELHRELLSQYAEVLERRAGESATLAVTAGPFSTAVAVREFERALAALPGVSGVVVREYPGDDRVGFDVRLGAR